MRCSEWLLTLIVTLDLSQSENPMDVPLALFPPSLILSR
jgi:hypothetical protein